MVSLLNILCTFSFRSVSRRLHRRWARHQPMRVRSKRFGRLISRFGEGRLLDYSKYVRMSANEMIGRDLVISTSSTPCKGHDPAGVNVALCITPGAGPFWNLATTPRSPCTTYNPSIAGHHLRSTSHPCSAFELQASGSCSKTNCILFKHV